VSIQSFIESIPAIDAHSHAAHVVAPKAAEEQTSAPVYTGLPGSLNGQRAVMNFAEVADLYSTLPMDDVLAIQADRHRLAAHTERLSYLQGQRRHTAMERELRDAYRDLYGANPDDETDVAAKYEQAARAGLRQMLGDALDKANIQQAIVMGYLPKGLQGDTRYLFVPNIDPFVFPKDNSRYKTEGANEIEVFDYVYAPIWRRAAEKHGYTGGDFELTCNLSRPSSPI
jgi:hypothetical protein